MRARSIALSVLASAVWLSCPAMALLGGAFDRQTAHKEQVLPRGEVGEAVLLGTVVAGTSRYRGEPCEHVFRLAHKRGEIDVLYPDCWFPEGFHRQTALEVIVSGTVQEGTLWARQIEPQLGGCCGGPHCYPVD